MGIVHCLLSFFAASYLCQIPSSVSGNDLSLSLSEFLMGMMVQHQLMEVLFYYLVIIFMMDHELAREAMFLADDLGMNNGDFAFILFRIDTEQILFSLRFPFLNPFRGRFRETRILSEGASKSFQNALTISFVINKDNLISDPEVLKIVSNLTQSPPFNISKDDGTYWKVRGRRKG